MHRNKRGKRGGAVEGRFQVDIDINRRERANFSANWVLRVTNRRMLPHRDSACVHAYRLVTRRILGNAITAKSTHVE